MSLNMKIYLFFLVLLPLASSFAEQNKNDYLFYCHSEHGEEIKAKQINNHLVVEVDKMEVISNETINYIVSSYQKEFAEAKREGADDYAMFKFSTSNYLISIGSGIDKVDYSDAGNRLNIINKSDGSSKTYWCGNDDINQLDSMKSSAD